MRRKTRLFAVLLLGFCVVLTACGSRRPLSDFVANSNGQSQTGGAGSNGSGTQAGSNGNTGLPGSNGGSVGPGATAPGAAPGAQTGQSGNTGNTGSAGGNTQGSGKSSGGQANTASDVGVTPTQIYVGDVFTKSGSFGPYQFTSMYYGAATYFDWLNDQGGINGRKVVLLPCDDGGQPTGNQNCVHRLIGNNAKGGNGVFAFVAEDCLACDGLAYMNQQHVPEVGGVAIDFKDYAYPNTYRYDSNPYPADGSIGYKGKLYQGTQQFRWFKQKLGVTKAGVIYYDNAAASKAAGQGFASGLRAEGIQVTEYAENVALPQWDSAVLDMKSRGIQALYDTLDVSGNQNLCKSIDSNHLVLKAKVSTISTWSQEVATKFDYPCRSYIYSVDQPGTLGYDQTSNPAVATFRQAFAKYHVAPESELAEWTLDGWASAMWFADAAKSCGANLTRACLVSYLNKPYGAQGLWWPRSNVKYNFNKTPYTYYQCIVVAKWNESQKTFQTVADFHNTCYNTPYVPYQPPPQ